MITIGSAKALSLNGTSAATAADLNSLSFDAGGLEASTLLGAHATGDSFWRVRLAHLSAWDFNYGAIVPSGAPTPPTGTNALTSASTDTAKQPTCTHGSIIGCEARTLGEAFDVSGAPFDLYYQSDRAKGYLSRNGATASPADAIVTYFGGGSSTTALTTTPVSATSLNVGSSRGSIGGLAINAQGQLLVAADTTVAGGIVLIDVSTGSPLARLVAGNNLQNCATVGTGPATSTCVEHANQIAVDGSGAIFVPDDTQAALLRIAAPVSGLSVGEISIADPSGSSVYVFDGEGRHLRTVDAFQANAGATSSSCAGRGSMPAGSGRVIYEFCYDPSGHLTSIYDRDGQATSFAYASSPSVVTITARDQQETKLALDANGLATTITDTGSGFDTQLAFQSGTDLLTDLTDRAGHHYKFDYDATGQLAHDISPAIGVATAKTYKTLTRVNHATGIGWTTNVGETNAMSTGGTMTTKHDFTSDPVAGVETQVTTAPDLSVTTTKNYYDGHVDTTSPDGTEVATTTGPDPRFGMQAPYALSTTVKMSLIPIDGGTATSQSVTWTTSRTLVVGAADWTDLKSVTTTPNSNQWTADFSRTNKTWTMTSPLGRTVTVVIDDEGRPVTSAASGIVNPVSFTYATATLDLGKLSSVSQGPTGGAGGAGSETPRSTSFTYSHAHAAPSYGYLESIQTGSNTTQLTPDALGRVTTVTRPDLATIGATYDHNGNVLTVTPSGESIHQFGVDELDLPSSYTPPGVTGMGGSTQTTYSTPDADRRIATRTLPDGSGSTSTVTFDSSGRLGTVANAMIGGAGTDTVTAAYDDANHTGHLVSLTGPFGPDGTTNEVVTFGYSSSLPAAVTWSGPVAGAVRFAYDNEFRLQTERVVHGGVNSDVFFARDADGVITGTSATSTGPSIFAVNPEMSGGKPTMLLGGTTLVGGSPATTLTDAYTYDDFGGLASYTVTAPAAVYKITIDQRDDHGRVLQKTETFGTTAVISQYTYDSVGRLATAQVGAVAATTYLYDSTTAPSGLGNSNRTKDGTTTLTYDEQDRLKSRGATSYFYDNAGFRTSRTATTAPTSTTYIYNAAGTLRSVTEGTTTYIYTIDGLGRRVGKSTKTGSGTPVLQEQYLYRNGLQIAAVLDGSSNLLWRFVYATGRYTPDYAVSGAGTSYRIVTDQIGSVRAVVGTDGTIIQRMDYDAWGNATAGTTPAHPVPLGFAGGLYDRDTKLVHFGAREYDPEGGVWTSKDPTLFGGGMNVYGYVGEDPVNHTDLTGLFEDGWDPAEDPQNALTIGQRAALAGAIVGAGVLVFVAVEAAPALAARLAPLLPGGAALMSRCQDTPALRPATGHQMLRQALEILKGMPGADRAGAFVQYAAQITAATKGQWSAGVVPAANALVYAGEGGEALVFDQAGNMFRGQLSNPAQFALAGSQYVANFEGLIRIK